MSDEQPKASTNLDGDVDVRRKRSIGRSKVRVLSLRRTVYWKVEERRLFVFVNSLKYRQREREGARGSTFSHLINMVQRVARKSPKLKN